mgnify:CR=1 FL=1|jgi:hypothetical protein|tara:strand:+ start:628 stop:906 length:279 start_codon:yes stop_codon:yes gene_type:complete
MIIKQKPYHIALTGIVIIILFGILPMSPGHELALAYVPAFFLGLGVILSILYWIIIKLLKRKLVWLYLLFLLGNLIWGSLMAIEMAYEVFNF